MSPKELIAEAQNNNAEQIALTDINSTSGSLYFAMEIQKIGLPVVLGVDFRIGSEQQFVAIAKNNQGFQNINFFLSSVLAKKEKLQKNAPALPDTY
ncbi:MAG: PHP domain-containing protein, partial [Bacteroidia bacterium]|nr:PHP domain-containing protein [Bacteroidia bacterium]